MEKVNRLEKKHIPILMYHFILKDADIPPNRHVLFVPLEMFEKQMEYLKKSGYTAVDFTLLKNVMDGKAGLPKKPVVIILDDGQKETLENVIPVLKKNGFKAVVAFVTGLTGFKGKWAPTSGIMDNYNVISKEQIIKMEKEGLVFESHSVSHCHFNSISLMDTKRELAESKKYLEKLLDKKITTIIYPYGEFNKNTVRLAKAAGYTFGVSVESKTRYMFQDLFDLRRIYIKGTDSMPAFKRKISAWYLWFRGRKEGRKPAK